MCPAACECLCTCWRVYLAHLLHLVIMSTESLLPLQMCMCSSALVSLTVCAYVCVWVLCVCLSCVCVYARVPCVCVCALCVCSPCACAPCVCVPCVCAPCVCAPYVCVPLLCLCARALQPFPPPSGEIDYPLVINSALPDDIRVCGWSDVPPEFSARFSARHRTYRYFFPRRDLDIRVRALL